MQNNNKGCLFGFVEIIKGLIKKPTPQQTPQYRRKYLLTRNELNFYKELKIVADKLNLSVLAKIRMADLVEAINNDYSNFAKIKSKHVDFALCNPENMYVVLLIELDDNSHKQQSRIERDKFIDEVYEQTGYKILHISNTNKLEEIIKSNII